MQTMIDFEDAPVFAMPGSDGIGMREGMLIEGPQGWGEFSPHDDCDDRVAARWLTAAIESGTVGWPDPVRGRVPIAVTVPAVDPRLAHEIVANAGCRTAEVTVATRIGSLADDVARLEAVRDALGADGAIRCNANGMWDVDTAVSAIGALDRSAGGLEFVVQPCRSAEELGAVRARIDVPIAASLPIRSDDAPRASLVGVADVAVLRCGPLGGVRRALVIADACGLPSVVASTGESSIGWSAGLALAGALPELPHGCALGMAPLLSGDLVAGPRSLIPVGGYLPVAPMPPAPDLALVRLYAVTDSGRIAWWRGRLHTARATDGDPGPLN
jgi:O-succinylbenzoate synthase